MKSITILPGFDKNGNVENYSSLELNACELYTIVGNTGSGKSRLIQDIEQLAQKDSVSRRTILLDEKLISKKQRQSISKDLVAHLGQNMRFVLDTSVSDFLNLHAYCRHREININGVIALANTITDEPVDKDSNLNLLSGGQTRALMIADIALICDSPIVLIDEIENAGIDKEKALSLFQNKGKLVLVVTHDLHTALMAKKRIVMADGAIFKIVNRSKDEEILYKELERTYHLNRNYQSLLRKGECLL